ncbi:MAG: hypothetical protein R2712_06715 [Vicinamibacterales bacterium]
MIRYGAKALPEGGWNTQPRLFMDGGLIVGDAANFVNSMRLKGIHLAMRSGMLAAETAFESVRAGDTSAHALSRYKQRVDESAIRTELYPVRNVHRCSAPASTRAPFSPGSRCSRAGGRRAATCTGMRATPACGPSTITTALRSARSSAGPTPSCRTARSPSTSWTSVHYSGTHHEEDQPSHLQVHTEVPHDLRRGVRTPLRSLLSRQRLRDGGQRPRRPPPADQRVQLRTARRATSWTRMA